MGLMDLFRAIFGPNLHVIRTGAHAIAYPSNKVERFSGYTLLASKCLWIIFKITSPILLVIFWRRGAFSLTDESILLWRKNISFALFISGVTGAACFTRGIGRYFNQHYREFLKVLDHCRRQPSEKNRNELNKLYDCDFYALPVEFVNNAPLKGKLILPRLNLFWKIIAVAMVKTIGRRLLYPGSLNFLNAALKPALQQGRTQFIDEKGARRAKIKTSDGNFIDTLFVDNRASSNPLGKTLVVCCEGNAGYCEIGIMSTPLQLGYSVLGWNHPGFACSTGEPMPSQELHAADAVMHFAKEHLKFTEPHIMIFAWSIGGFPATWLAAHYPNISGLVLDATFDDLLPLALVRMPKFLNTTVTHVVQHYLNLNIADQLCRYDGPVLLIRRTLDEILTINHEDEELAGNRGDHLLRRLLKHRYPDIVNEETIPILNQWLKAHRDQQAAMLENMAGTEQVTERLEDLLNGLAVADPRELRFPVRFEKKLNLATRKHLTLYLAKLHICDLEDTHCTPLPVTMFTQPWHPQVQERN